MEVISSAMTVNDLALSQPNDPSAAHLVYRLGALIFFLLLTVVIGLGQTPSESQSIDKNAEVFDGVISSNVYGLGKSVKIIGTVKEGAVAIGGDVIVQGTVEGDVAAIGGSVIQLEGARIGGDVIIVGGSYHHFDKTPNRNQSSTTIMYAGYEQELKEMMRNPKGLLSPRWSPTYIGLRLLSVLLWFVVSLGLTAAMPGAVGRGVARLQLTSLRVAGIGFAGGVVVGLGAEACLFVLPTQFSALVGMMTILFIILAGVFGRVVLYAATGRWIQRHYFPVNRTSESVALLLGAFFWAILLSLPYVWPFVVAVIVVLSLGLALTAGRGNAWKKAQVI
jgi:hypothetical protein